MRRALAAGAAACLLVATLADVAAATDGPSDQRHQTRFSIASIVLEWNVDGTPIEDGPSVGRSRLRRSSGGLRATVQLRGLEPGGVYTAWWVVPQADGTFPDDVFVASGGGAVADERGRARLRLRARTDQAGITGFMPDGVNEISFAPLTEPRTATVRIEIAYHGPVADAGADLETWLADFWTGSACPPETPNPNPAQPHCPVYFAATHPGAG